MESDRCAAFEVWLVIINDGRPRDPFSGCADCTCQVWRLWARTPLRVCRLARWAGAADGRSSHVRARTRAAAIIKVTRTRLTPCPEMRE